MSPGMLRAGALSMTSPARSWRWPMPPERDYEIGRGKPPKHSQWKPGQSGNRKGRPPGAKNIKTLLGEALNQQVAVNDNGRQRSMTKAEAMATQLANRAAQGDARAT